MAGDARDAGADRFAGIAVSRCALLNNTNPLTAEILVLDFWLTEGRFLVSFSPGLTHPGLR